MSFVSDTSKTLPKTPTRSGLEPEITAAIREYSSSMELSQTQSSALVELEQQEICFVVTGQQTGLYLSPLLVLHKLATAVALAKEISKTRNVTCLPLFWLQSEDHDLDEISTATCSTANINSTTLEIDWSQFPENTDKRRSVAYQTLPDSLIDLNSRLGLLVEQSAYAKDLIEKIDKSYTPGKSIVDAFAQLLLFAFADYPLVIFHPLLPGVAKHTAVMFQKSIENYKKIEEALEDYSKTTDTPNTLIHLRSNSPLCFYSPEPRGSRYRFDKDDSSDSWNLIGSKQQVSKEVLNRHLTDFPERFSSSALLRPLLQNTLLPTCAYVGGPAEVSYLKQAEVVAKVLSVPHAPVVPRAHVTLIEGKTQKLLSQLNISISDLLDEDSLALKLIRNMDSTNPDPEQLRQSIDNQINSLFELLEQQTLNLDPTLGKPLSKTRDKTEHAISTYLGKYQKALEEKHSIEFNRLSRLKELVLPNNIPQERALSAVPYLADYGIEVIPKIVDAIAKSKDNSLEITL